MNILLFEPEEVGRPLAAKDPRAVHLQKVLKRGPGDRFDAGVVNGPRGKGRLTGVGAAGVEWAFEPTGPVETLDPVDLIVGLPRPQTARKILGEAAALGVRAMHFVVTDKAEEGYARSALWSSGEWRRHVLAGVEQAFTTAVPEVTFGRTLSDVLGAISAQSCVIALDNYESPLGLSSSDLTVSAPAALIVGAERGWSSAERDLLRARGARLAHLGARVLRTETACVAALAILKGRLGMI